MRPSLATLFLGSSVKFLPVPSSWLTGYYHTLTSAHTLCEEFGDGTLEVGQNIAESQCVGFGKSGYFAALMVQSYGFGARVYEDDELRFRF